MPKLSSSSRGFSFVELLLMIAFFMLMGCLMVWVLGWLPDPAGSHASQIAARQAAAQRVTWWMFLIGLACVAGIAITLVLQRKSDAADVAEPK